MAKADFYETLGVSKTADEKELKSAFRKMAMKYHPDKNPGDTSAEQKFKDVNEAYDTLKDPQKRAAYDRYGHAAFEHGGMGGAGFGGGFQAGGFSDIFEDIFGEMMGGGRQRRSAGGRERGGDGQGQGNKAAHRRSYGHAENRREGWRRGVPEWGAWGPVQAAGNGSSRRIIQNLRKNPISPPNFRHKEALFGAGCHGASVPQSLYLEKYPWKP